MEIDGPAKERFELLLRKYDELDRRAESFKETKQDIEAARDNVRNLLRDEIINMGLGRGSKLEIPGLGSFSFTTQRYHQLPADKRETFALMLIERSLIQKGYDQDEAAAITQNLRGTEVALLTIGKGDLDSWCKERQAEVDDDSNPLPSYITFYEDKFVPRIHLESAKARRQEKAAKKAAH